MGPARSILHRRVPVVVTWLIATAVAGAVTWAAVSRLGPDGTATAVRPLSPADVRQRLQHVPADPVASRATTAPAPGVPSAPVSSRRATPASRTTAPSSRSWQVTGGAVGAACQGGAIDLLYAAPQDGWAYRLRTASRAMISVEFFNGPQAATLTAHCERGVPIQGTGTPGEEGGKGDNGPDE